MDLTHSRPQAPARNEIRLTYCLLATAAFVWLWSAYEPVDTHTWMIEQVATLIAAVTVLWLGRSVHFDAISRVSFFLLFCIHTLGTHYTYSLTPYPEFSEFLFGSSPNDWFNWQRNHYDRFVHFAFGALMYHPIKQVLAPRLRQQNPPVHWLSGHIIVSVSALYELLEWAAAITFGGDMGIAYLGTQGDIWDAQIDIALGALGWMVACLMHYSVTLCRLMAASNQQPSK